MSPRSAESAAWASVRASSSDQNEDHFSDDNIARAAFSIALGVGVMGAIHIHHAVSESVSAISCRAPS